MIEYREGDLFTSGANVLVNPVNCIGTMGAGLAPVFKERFPDESQVYIEEARLGRVRIGRMVVVPCTGAPPPRWICHFPTKVHWHAPSELEFICRGLEHLRVFAKAFDFGTVALPALGCGRGGLDWTEVQAEIERYLASCNTEWWVYLPHVAHR